MSELVRRVHRIGGEYGPLEVRLAVLGDMQHGVVARWQLLGLGFSGRQVERRMEQKRLIPILRGVYGVNRSRLESVGHWMAAVLAVGPDALLSAHAATALWDLRPAPARWIDVLDPRRTRVSHHHIRVHSTRSLLPEDCAIRRAVPVTSVTRTMLEYAEAASHQQIRHAFEAAERQEVLDFRKLESVLERFPSRRGTAKCRAVMADLTDSVPWTESELERAFLALIRSAGLPEPQSQAIIVGERVDLYWPAFRLVVECDGWPWHRTRARFEEDRRKDALFQLAQLRVLRPTQRRVEREPAQLLAEVRALMASA